MTAAGDSVKRIAKRFQGWARRAGRILAAVLTVAAFGCAIATYVAITGGSSMADNARLVLILLQIDLALFLLLCIVVARHLVGLWLERRRGELGARLQSRLVILFSLIAVAPAIAVSAFSAVFFNFGLETWFSERVRTAVTESSAVAEAYLEEHLQVIRGDILSMARDLDRSAALLHDNPRRFSRIVAAQGVVRNLSEAYVLDGTGHALASWSLGFVLDRSPAPLDALDRAREGEVILLTSERDDRVRAVMKLDRIVDAFLYVGRYVEPNVLEHIDKTRRVVAEYQDIRQRRSTIEITFAMIYIVVGLLLVFVAIWVGLVFANRMSQPISQLASAAERVRTGDLSARVPEGRGADELGLLARAFNRMTSQLEGQRRELVRTNRQLDERRHFIETVLAGVSAGVIGLDGEGRINLANRSASELTGIDLGGRIGSDIRDLVPETDEMLRKARGHAGRPLETQILFRRGIRERTLLVRLTSEVVDERVSGFVVTFDDITELVAAQRKAAWSDAARRIAHEIKNPLTPIQLSAERLRRKYLSEVTSDHDTFSNCIDTIVRRVGDIGHMVNEFSSFAKLPDPEIRVEDIVSICREALVLPRNAHREIEFEVDLPSEPLEIPCDRRLMSQVLTNLIQNAVDATCDASSARPRIEVSLRRRDDVAVLEISDNGTGLPTMDRERLTEPYVTTRARGTGLGLAIVKKILEDHRALLELEDRAGGGATARVVLLTGMPEET